MLAATAVALGSSLVVALPFALVTWGWEPVTRGRLAGAILVVAGVIALGSA